MIEWLSSPLFGVAVSILAYGAGYWLQQKLRSPAANPLLIAIILVIAFLQLTGIPLESYEAGGGFIEMFLAPATACLALSIYRQLPGWEENLFPGPFGSGGGAGGSWGGGAPLCHLFRLDDVMTASLLPKSVTTPIAIGIAEQLGGSTPVTVAAVILTGIAGAMLCPLFIRWFHIKEPVTAGLAIGVSSHAVGTSRAVQLGEIEGAMSGLAIGTAGLVTVLFSVFL